MCLALRGGSIGSGVEEERSKLRYAVRHAAICEHVIFECTTALWTTIACFLQSTSPILLHTRESSEVSFVLSISFENMSRAHLYVSEGSKIRAEFKHINKHKRNQPGIS